MKKGDYLFLARVSSGHVWFKKYEITSAGPVLVGIQGQKFLRQHVETEYSRYQPTTIGALRSLLNQMERDLRCAKAVVSNKENDRDTVLRALQEDLRMHDGEGGLA